MIKWRIGMLVTALLGAMGLFGLGWDIARGAASVIDVIAIPIGLVGWYWVFMGCRRRLDRDRDAASTNSPARGSEYPSQGQG